MEIFQHKLYNYHFLQAINVIDFLSYENNKLSFLKFIAIWTEFSSHQLVCNLLLKYCNEK